MPGVDVISFADALERSNTGKRHLLLGNGFSIALKPDIFTYEALYNDANFASVPHAEAIFDALETRDFETVIKVLVDMSRVLTGYDDASTGLTCLERPRLRIARSSRSGLIALERLPASDDPRHLCLHHRRRSQTTVGRLSLFDLHALLCGRAARHLGPR